MTSAVMFFAEHGYFDMIIGDPPIFLQFGLDHTMHDRSLDQTQIVHPRPFPLNKLITVTGMKHVIQLPYVPITMGARVKKEISLGGVIRKRNDQLISGDFFS